MVSQISKDKATSLRLDILNAGSVEVLEYLVEALLEDDLAVLDYLLAIATGQEHLVDD